jgi:hypothetical protein
MIKLTRVVVSAGVVVVVGVVGVTEKKSKSIY